MKRTPAQKIRDYFNNEYWKKVLESNRNGKYKQPKRIKR